MFVKKRAILVEIIFIFLLSLTPLLWFRPGEMMVGHDNVFPLEPKSFLKARLYTWTEKQGFGDDQSLIMGTIPIHLIDALPNILGFSLINTQKIVYVFWFFLIGLSAYVLASFINPQSRFFKLFTAVFYQFNFFVLQAWWIGERTKFSAYIAMPLVISVFLLVYRQKIGILKAAILNSLILFFFNGGGIFGIPLFGGFFVSVGLFILYFSLISFFQKRYWLIGKLILTAILSVVCFLLINAYYFLPAFSKVLADYGSQLSQKGGVGSYVSWAKMISVGASPLNLFRLQGMAEWYDNPQHPYAKYFFSNSILIIISFIWPFLVFSSLILIKDRKKLKLLLYFFLVYLAGVFFAGGTHPPLGFLYILMMEFIPGFAIFRTPFYKFAPALFLSSIFLCAFTLDFLKEKLMGLVQKKPRLRFLSTAFCFFWLVLIPTYHFPFFTGGFFNWRDNFSTRLKLPQYLFEFSNWAEREKKDDLGILVVPPPDEGWNYDVYEWGYLSLFPLPRLLTQEPIFLKDELLTEEERDFLRLAYKSLLTGEKEVFEKVASILRLGYLLIRKDFAYKLNWIKTDNPQDYQLMIEQTFGFPKEKELGKWIIYKITGEEALPKIYGVRNLLVAPPSHLYQELFFKEKVEPSKLVILEERKDRLPVVQKNGFLVSCLSCQLEKESDFLIFPSVTFLPGSPFYFLVNAKEAILDKKIKDPIAKVYHEMGLSLKRTAELRRMLIESPPKSDEDRIKSVVLFQNVLSKIEETFFEISDSDEKFLIAEKLNFYLTVERRELRLGYQQTAMGIEAKRILEAAIQQLDLLIEKIKPYLFNKDFETKKLFSFNVPEKGKLRILLGRESIKEFLDREAVMNLEVDGQTLIGGYEEVGEWLDFGEHIFDEGNHHLLLTIPPSPNLTTSWISTTKRFAEGVKDCFVSKVSDFTPKSDYQVTFQYKNILYEDLSYYSKEEAVGEEQEYFFKPNSFVNLYSRAKEGERRFIIFPNKESKSLEIGFCAEDLTEGDFNQIFRKIEVKKLISPLLFVEAVDQVEKGTVDVSSQKLNPTKFLLNVSNVDSPFILVFLEKFSSDWQLSPQVTQSHFPVFGYANGWLIDKTGDYQLMLEYSPQKAFYRGIGGTVVFFILAIIILKFKKR